MTTRDRIAQWKGLSTFEQECGHMTETVFRYFKKNLLFKFSDIGGGGPESIPGQRAKFCCYRARYLANAART